MLSSVVFLVYFIMYIFMLSTLANRLWPFFNSDISGLLRIFMFVIFSPNVYGFIFFVMGLTAWACPMHLVDIFYSSDSLDCPKLAFGPAWTWSVAWSCIRVMALQAVIYANVWDIWNYFFISKRNLLKSTKCATQVHKKYIGETPS